MFTVDSSAYPRSLPLPSFLSADFSTNLPPPIKCFTPHGSPCCCLLFEMISFGSVPFPSVRDLLLTFPHTILPAPGFL